MIHIVSPLLLPHHYYRIIVSISLLSSKSSTFFLISQIGQPSCQPSNQPTSQPTRQPSAQPVVRPTGECLTSTIPFYYYYPHSHRIYTRKQANHPVNLAIGLVRSLLSNPVHSLLCVLQVTD